MLAAIVSYYGDDGDAAEELEALGDGYMTRSLKYLQKIVTGAIDYRRLRQYSNFRGVPIFKAQSDDRTMIFAVEDDGDDGNKVTILCAGRYGDEADALETTNSRAANWFTIVRSERSR
ncbi:MAG TPA: hypothetical protein VFQ82_13640 [Stellaceae bacterium]|jgi:hypothetical protein|nr:hypothetical protein [Stellaceae bacterium]